MTTFKCPQCVAASLTSKVGLIYPYYKGGAGGICYFQPNGSLNIADTSLSVIYWICTNNHSGYMNTPPELLV